MASVAVCGCSLSSPEPEQPEPARTFSLEDNPFRLQDRPTESVPPNEVLIRLSVRFDVLRVEVPAGAVSGSQSLWNHLDEEAVGSDSALLLRQNGFRVGLGHPDDWAPIESILRAANPALAKPSAAAIQGQEPLTIEDGQQPRDQTIFYYPDPAGPAVGKSVDESRNVLRIDHTVDPGDTDAVVLRVVPEIRQKRVGLRIRRTATGLVNLPAYEGEVLEELAFSLRVPRGCFLLIGPGQRSSLELLAGRAFMTADGADGRYEFVYVIWPQVVRTTLTPVP